ncbi:hypothetical protein [Synechococcus sp. PROS-9-1]|uniref:hypothetical protein n=1 Tax=Synechococcus sp. PROS-9-1 TaxID=1968775 RepID=UPI001647051F|nr:hypothetical protein [Synechococcus sp. PROS-9-1]
MSTWQPAPGATLRCNPASMQGKKGKAKMPRPLMILGQTPEGLWLAIPTSTSWACLDWQKPIQNEGDWGIKGGWDFRYKSDSYWAPNEYLLLTTEEILDLADTYGKLNYAPEHIWLHGMAEYKTAWEKDLLGDQFFDGATHLKKY